MTPRAVLDEGLARLALALPADAREKLLAYTALLAKWNRTYNLTAIRDPKEMVTHHLLDSLAVVTHLPIAAGATLADVGSGGGLPGIPLAIARPDWRITLNDANEKKAAFLRQASFELALPNVCVHEGRAEAWRPAQRFSLVISRAFAGLAKFIGTCRHLVAMPEGTLVAMKGALSEDEYAAVPVDCHCQRPIVLEVPFLGAQRQLVICRPCA